MRLVLCLAAAVALGACASAPKAPAPAAGAQPAAAAQPAAKATKVAAKDAKAKEGKQQCKVTSSLGSNMRKQKCTSQAEREAEVAAGKESVKGFENSVRATSVPQR